jgi:cytochrome c-type biogenesis protein CcsB
METEFYLLWSAVTLYGLGAFSYVLSMLFKKESLITSGMASALLGFLVNAFAVALRWVESGIPPFLDISESISGAVCVGMLVFLVVQTFDRRIRSAGVLVMPVSFLLLGWAGSLSAAPEITGGLPPQMQSYWLWVHIISAALGYGTVMIAAAVGLLFLIKGRYPGYERLPSTDALDSLGYRFVSVGFVMLGVMIVSGAFWSNLVHGNYWGWDPVEVWSLISWLIYGIYLHLRTTFRWRGRKLAWYALIAFPVMVVSLWGVPFVLERFHQGFRIEH